MPSLNISNTVTIEGNEIEISAIRACGSGGQKVNKVSAAIHLRFDIEASSLPENYKEKYKATSYQVWEEGYQPKLIQTDAMMISKINYIHQNPVKRGYVDQPAHWRYSSARNYEGEKGLIEEERFW